MSIDVYINDGSPNADEVGSGRVSHIETCLFWRCARRVLNEGNPASENVVVCVPGKDGGAYPLFIMTATRSRRLVCWLALPELVCAPNDEEKLHLIDHVTLDLRSRNSHSSAYSGKGGKLLTAAEWKLHPFPNNGVSLWFGFALRLSVVERQWLERNQWIRFPTPDVERRKGEYVRFFQELRFVDARLPSENASSTDGLCGFVYIVDGPIVKLSHDLVPPFDSKAAEFLEGAEEPREFSVKSTALAVGSIQLGLLMGCLPWRLREDGPWFITPGPSRLSQ